MVYLVHDLVSKSKDGTQDRPAISYQNVSKTYLELEQDIDRISFALIAAGLVRQDRVAVYSEKRIETVVSIFATSAAGGVYVPINPLLKSEQVVHIINDCTAEFLITTADRFLLLDSIFEHCPSIKTVILMDKLPSCEIKFKGQVKSWDQVISSPPLNRHICIDSDIAAILYTSGSTGKPKGVVLSHRNIVAGAVSVAQYLEINKDDRILCVLPFSFDYGMNQLTSTFLVGGCAVLINYLFPRDIINLLDSEKITGLAGVPPLWIQLSNLQWPDTVTQHLRFVTNSGGHMPREILSKLRTMLPRTKFYLMYGLTESFRSTYLSPNEIDTRPDSVGKAIPNAEILICRPDGSLCAPYEPGELIHRGVHVAMGYWNDPQKTSERFKPIPNQDKNVTISEIGVWSGDTFYKDNDGYLYFVGRRDEMIKTSGYRVSPTEIEDILYESGMIAEAVAFGLKHPTLGQAIVVVVTCVDGQSISCDEIKKIFQDRAPTYMVPSHIEIQLSPLPRNPNGKIDRKKISTDYDGLFKI